MDQPQSQQTEKLIEEMLEFLESASDDEENLNDKKVPHDEGFAKEIFENNGKELKELTLRPGFDKLKANNKSKSNIGKQLKKLKEEFPIWNTQEIVSNKNSIYSLPPSTNGFEEPLWNSESIHSIEKSSEALGNEEVHQKDNYKDWYKQSGDDNNRPEVVDDDDIFVQEVHRAIYGDVQGHPINGSPEYFEAAQNYAIYGKDFLDFPENLHNIIKGGRGGNCLMENGNASNDQQYMGNQEFSDENCLEAAQNNFGKASCNIATSLPTNSAAATPTVAAVASSTAAYYQLCNGIQQRPGSSNSATYGMFLGNKVTYMAAAPSAPTLVYNQQTATTANFVSNSLANAALATSPTILYSNPMLNATTQQYLNAFFKETQLLNSAGSSNQANATTTGFYERLVYAQMLQQQIYNQNQQAAAFAAMIQHKQRVNAAAVAAAAAAAAAIAARQTTSASNANATNATNQSNGLQTSTSNATASGVNPGAVGTASSTSSSVAFPPLNQCGRQASMVANNTSDILAMKQPGNTVANQQPAITINCCDKSSNGTKE